MNKDWRIFVLIFAALLIAAAGFYAFFQTGTDPAAAPESEMLTREARYERALNTMLDEVSGAMLDYKTLRRVLTDLTRPDNIRHPRYVEENYKLMQDLIPQLEAKRAAVIKALERGNAQIQNLVSSQEGSGAAISESWRAVKIRTVQPYLTYFRLEEQEIEARRALMELYYTHATKVSFDPQTGALVIAGSDSDIAERARALQKQIETLSAQKTALLRDKGKDRQAPMQK